MSSINYGPAQPLYDMVRSLYDKGEHAMQYLNLIPTPPSIVGPKQDTSWHDQMLRQANQSFQQQPKPDMMQMRRPLRDK